MELTKLTVKEDVTKPAKIKENVAEPKINLGYYQALCEDYKDAIPSKYMVVKTTVNGITFASKKEAKRYEDLLKLEKSGEVESLQIQPVYVLQEGFKLGKKKYNPIIYNTRFQLQRQNN